jgi:glycosyltransferase involved in cell wall biosynthesis
MVTSSYPRFPGDTVGTFMEPIARGVAARGHEVHVVAPWHPAVARPAHDDGVHLHFYRYAPHRALNVFGYAGALRQDVSLRWSALAATPLALAAGWRCARAVARRAKATIMHGHWVLPGGLTALLACRDLPLVVSLHGSDVYVAERHRLLGGAARAVFRRAAWVTACSADLRDRAVALGASPALTEVVPYGVDAAQFHPIPAARTDVRARLGIGPEAPLVLAVGRLVRKKGFEYLIDAMALLAGSAPAAVLVIAGGGDLEPELRARATRAGLGGRVHFPGPVDHADVARLLAAADVVAVPSVRDDYGNVDGLPNVVLEAMASGTPVVASRTGGIGDVVRDGETGRLVPERDVRALADALAAWLRSPAERTAVGLRARRAVQAQFLWTRVAERFEAAYDRAVRSRRAGPLLAAPPA